MHIFLIFTYFIYFIFIFKKFFFKVVHLLKFDFLISFIQIIFIDNYIYYNIFFNIIIKQFLQKKKLKKNTIIN